MPCFLEALKYSKTSKQHGTQAETPAIHFFPLFPRRATTLCCSFCWPCVSNLKRCCNSRRRESGTGPLNDESVSAWQKAFFWSREGKGNSKHHSSSPSNWQKELLPSYSDAMQCSHLWEHSWLELYAAGLSAKSML